MMTPESFVELLHGIPAMPNVFNPWRDQDPLHDTGPEAPRIRAGNLTRYLAERVGRAKHVLIGEAPGYQGCHFSGIAMTSERILLGGKPTVPAEAVFEGPKLRTSRAVGGPGGANEPTATIAWGLMLGMGLDPRSFVFWNAFPFHPHKPGDLLTNRAPDRAELHIARAALPAMLELLAGARVTAVGRVAQKTLAELGVDAKAVRHPAMGGASQFRAEMGLILAE